MTVALISDRQIRALNRRFRGIARVTDVLSFPENGVGRNFRFCQPWAQFTHTGLQNLKFLPTPFLGDVVIAIGRAGRQARQAGHSLECELRLLALHGLLHLLGYNHEQDDGTMARVERRLRRKGGLREGLLERASAGSPSGNSSVAPRAAMRPAGKARRVSISGIFERGATLPGGMQRRPNAAGVARRAAGA